MRQRLRPRREVQTALPSASQAMPLEDLLDGTRRRPANLGPLPPQEQEKLAGTPSGKLLATGDDPVDEESWRRGRAVMGFTREVLERRLASARGLVWGVNDVPGPDL